MKYTKEILLLTLLIASNNLFSQWTWLNPKQSGYACSNIIFTNRQNGFILYNNGDLTSTVDQGNKWVFQQNFPRTSTMDIKDSTGIICGLGGVYISSDNGKSWIRKRFDFSDNLFKADVVSRDTIFMAGNYGNIYRSYNRGNSWSIVNCGVTISSIEFINSMVGYVGGQSSYIMKTIDGGQTWQRNVTANTIPSNTLAIKFTNLNNGYAFRTHSSLLKTTDGGLSWTEMNMSDDVFSFHFLNDNIGFACGELGITYRTDNAGQTWNFISASSRIYEYDLYSTFFISSDTGFTVGARGRILKTSNGGISWSSYSPFYFDINDIILASSKTAFATVGNTIYKTNDSGTTWQKLPLMVGTNYTEYDVFKFGHFKNADTGIVTATDYGRVYKTYNGGIDWQEINPTLPYAYSYQDVNDLQFLNDSIGYLCLSNSGGGIIVKTKNLGSTWSNAWSSLYYGENFNKIFFIDEQTGYASRYQKLFKTTDSAKTWVEQTGLASNNISSIWFTNAKIGFLTGSSGMLKRTVDSGNTWTNITIAPGYYDDIFNVKFVSPSLGYLLASSGAIYKSIDSGKTWNLSTKANYYAMKSLKFGKDSTVYIAGQNGAILRSDFKTPLISSCSSNIWTGNAGSAWENPANWSCGTPPGPASSVIIPSGSIVTINSNVVIFSIQVNPGASLSIGAYSSLKTLQ